jgi:hypothetical protein
MAPKDILATLSNIICSPCAGTFGRWKAVLQDDDADLWNDLTLINSIPDEKPPDIPKVVEVISCSDGSAEDISTLACETSFHQHYHLNQNNRPTGSKSSSNNNHNNYTPEEEEKSFTPSPKRTAGFLQKGNKHAFRYYAHADPELEHVLEDIELEDSNSDSSNDDSDGGGNDHGDAELESIMGPRSQISTARSQVSRSIRRASSAPVVASYTTPRLPSLLQQQREREHCHSSRSSMTRTVRQQHYQHYSDYHSICHSPSKEDSKDDQEYRDNFDDDEAPASSSIGGFGQHHKHEDHDIYNDCDGSSYSSVCQKVSFFKKKRKSFFRSSGSSGYKKAGANGGWLPLEHSGSSTEDTTVPTTVKSKSSFQPSPHIGRLKFKTSAFH